jgi:hypothetical protein
MTASYCPEVQVAELFKAIYMPSSVFCRISSCFLNDAAKFICINCQVVKKTDSLLVS